MPLPDSFEAALARFKERLQSNDRSPLTQEGYLKDLRLFAAWIEEEHGESFSPAAVTPRDVAGFKRHLQTGKGLKPASINRKLAALAAFFRWAHSEGLVGEDPSSFIKGVKEIRAAPKALERKDQTRLLREVARPRTKDPTKRPWRDLAIVTLLLHTGLRVGELCALKFSDIEMSERKGSLVVRAGKGGKYREVPLNAEARKALKDYLEVRPKWEGPLFRSQKGGALSPSAVWRVVEKVGRAAGVELSPHTLRHTFGTNLLRGGTDLVSVATLLGHESLGTTAIYTRPSQNHLAQEVQKLSLLGEDEA